MKMSYDIDDELDNELDSNENSTWKWPVPAITCKS